MYEGSICDVDGILVGIESDYEAKTGVSVVLCKNGAVAGVDVRGAAPGTRETDLLNPQNTVDRMHAVALCGGSAFGLDAAGGVMRALEEEGIGFETQVARVPIVGAAVLFDLAVGSAEVRPDAQMGYRAAKAAGTKVLQGAHGVGTGATCGKLLPGAVPHRGGVGTSSVKLSSGVVVGAYIAVNALGDVYNPITGVLMAAGRLDGEPTAGLLHMVGQIDAPFQMGQNTTIGVIATNAKLDKAGANRLATIGHDGLALSIRPVHTPMDGDTLFAFSTGEIEVNPVLLHALATQAVWQAVLNAVMADD